MKNRIAWQRRPKRDSSREHWDGGNIDEIVIPNATIHIEQMNVRQWMVIIDQDAKSGGGHWHGHFTCNSKGHMTFTEYEADITWDEDVSYEES